MPKRCNSNKKFPTIFNLKKKKKRLTFKIINLTTKTELQNYIFYRTIKLYLYPGKH